MLMRKDRNGKIVEVGADYVLILGERWGKTAIASYHIFCYGISKISNNIIRLTIRTHKMNWEEAMLKKIIALIFIFGVLPLHVALADCSSLALKFSQDPNSLSDNELAQLRKCVNDKLQAKFHYNPPPPPAKRAVAPLAPSSSPTPPAAPVPAPAVK